MQPGLKDVIFGMMECIFVESPYLTYSIACVTDRYMHVYAYRKYVYVIVSGCIRAIVVSKYIHVCSPMYMCGWSVYKFACMTCLDICIRIYAIYDEYLEFNLRN